MAQRNLFASDVGFMPRAQCDRRPIYKPIQSPMMYRASSDVSKQYRWARRSFEFRMTVVMPNHCDFFSTASGFLLHRRDSLHRFLGRLVDGKTARKNWF